MPSTPTNTPATAPAAAKAAALSLSSAMQTPATATKALTPKRARTPAKKVAAPKAATTPSAKVTAPAAASKVAKPAPKFEAKATKVPDVKLKADKLLKDKKPKLVRDSFTIPKLEYLILDQLKQRSGTLGTVAKKSELIRAGIKALAEMPDASFLAAIKAVPTIKTGRPLKD